MVSFTQSEIKPALIVFESALHTDPNPDMEMP